MSWFWLISERTFCSLILSVIIVMINKLHSCLAVFQFCWSLVWLRTKLDSTQSYYHYLYWQIIAGSNDNYNNTYFYRSPNVMFQILLFAHAGWRLCQNEFTYNRTCGEIIWRCEHKPWSFPPWKEIIWSVILFLSLPSKLSLCRRLLTGFLCCI